MIISSLSIKKFRGFQDVEFKLGTHLTIIAGQNGTQKTTLLGILSQPFSVTEKENPLYGEKPLCGGNFKSAFAEKFKLSDVFDTPKNHEWTLNLDSRSEETAFTVESIKRGDDSIRFWKKGDRSKGSGYIQRPVIYLSLSRLFPIGEDESIASSSEIRLSEEEVQFYQYWHDKILCIPDSKMTSTAYLASRQKNTLGANTNFYDWKSNSAGQDNIGKILLAILSFKRLTDKHGEAYCGGILAIDELDATLYPASQIKLIEAFRKFASQFKIQFICTTHSLCILEEVCRIQNDPKICGQTNVVYLERADSRVKALEKLSFDVIRHKLNITLADEKIAKIPAFTEDKESEYFLKCLLKRKSSLLNYQNCTLGCPNLIDLSRKKIPSFVFPNSLIILDGDVREDASKIKQVEKLKNILLLPDKKSPEKLIADFLDEMSDESPGWSKIQEGYTKQLAFRDYKLKDIHGSRETAKVWFRNQKKYWGKNCSRIFNLWINEHASEVDLFIKSFDNLYKKYTS